MMNLQTPSGEIIIEPLSKEEFNEGLEERNSRAFNSFYIPMKRLMDAQESAQLDQIKAMIPESPGFYVGARLGDRLIGYSHSYFKNPATLRTGVSAVDPDFRRLGIYTAMTQYTLSRAQEIGFQRVESAHPVFNNAVIIAKLKLGFMIYGTENFEELGPLVVLAKLLNEKRRKLFGFKMGEFIPDQEYLRTLGVDV